MNYDVFISCKSEDYKIAEEVYQYLKDNGFHVFLSSKELRRMKDSEYTDAISDALDSAYHLIVLSSSVANIKSKWVKFEWTTFLNELLSERKHGQIMTLVKDIPVAELPIQLRHYEMFNLDDYKERILPYIETPDYLQRRLEAKERERLEAEKKKIEEAEKQEKERKKKELIRMAEDYHQKMSTLQSIEGKKITHILKELCVTTRNCPVCNEIVSVSKSFCPTCGWKLSPIHGIPELIYLVEIEDEQLSLSKSLFAERTNFQSKLQHLNESVTKAEQRTKELANLNKDYLKAIDETARKNKKLELEYRKSKEWKSKLESELNTGKDTIQRLREELQSVIEERDRLQKKINIAKATIEDTTIPHFNSTEKKYKITLVSAGTSKLQIVKLIKETLGWGLKEAKEFTDAVPSTFPNFFSENEMHKISHLIEKCGGTLQKVYIQENTPAVSAQKATIIARNAPCPCGSGKKYKNCHGRNM